MDIIFASVAAERAAQDLEWGGAAHDDSHELHEWCYFVAKQNTLAGSAAMAGGSTQFEKRMVKVAALAVAAVESSRRQRAANPERRETKEG